MSDAAYVALTLPDADAAPDAVFFLKCARRALALLDCGTGSLPKVSTPRLRTAADTLELRLTAAMIPEGPLRVVIRALPFRGAPFTRDDAAQVLAAVALDVIEMADVSDIEWDDARVHLTAEEFIDLRRYVSPRRARILPAGRQPPCVQPPCAQPASAEPPQQTVPRKLPIRVSALTPDTGMPQAAVPDCDAEARRLVRRFLDEVPDAGPERRPASVPIEPRKLPEKPVARREVVPTPDIPPSAFGMQRSGWFSGIWLRFTQ